MVCFNGVCDAEVDEFEGALDENKVGGLEIRVDDVVLVNGADALEHFLPVVACEAEVQLGIHAIELQADDAGEIRFAEFHKLG